MQINHSAIIQTASLNLRTEPSVCHRFMGHTVHFVSILEGLSFSH